MDAIPPSTKEQHPVLKEDSLEWENNNPETEKKENLKTLIFPVSLKMVQSTALCTIHPWPMLLIARKDKIINSREFFFS